MIICLNFISKLDKDFNKISIFVKIVINLQAVIKDKHIDKTYNKELDDTCDECKSKDESVSQNLILTGFKICKSCRVSKTIFPI